MKVIYQELRDYLLKELTSLAEVDLYNGQYDNGQTISTPTIYLEFLPTSWETTSKNTQTGQVTIKVHIVQNNYASTRGTTGYTEEYGALEYLDFIEKVHQALQGISLNENTPLDRTFTEPDSNHDGLLIEKVNYTFEYHDTSTDPERDFVEVTPTLDVVTTAYPAEDTEA